MPERVVAILNGDPICPATPEHGSMQRRSRALTKEQAWCGDWFDCQRCHSSVLFPSPALLAELEAQSARLANSTGAH